MEDEKWQKSSIEIINGIWVSVNPLTHKRLFSAVLFCSIKNAKCGYHILFIICRMIPFNGW